MSAPAEVERVYAALEESARLMQVDCSPERVRPILTAFGDALEQAMMSFSVASGERHVNELDYTITVPAGGDDPYARALAHDLVAPTEHPVGSLLADTSKHCPIGSYLIDSGIVGGFKKVYAFFPGDELQDLAELARIPSMPRSVAENVDLFTSHGLDRVKMIGIDYQQQTMNLYFGDVPKDHLEPENIASLLTAMGLPKPSPETLEFARNTFSIYVTFHWDTPSLDRVCYAVPPARRELSLPGPVEPQVAEFARSAPYVYDGNRWLIYAVAWSPNEEFYKLGSYYQLPPEKRKLLMAFDTE